MPKRSPPTHAPVAAMQTSRVGGRLALAFSGRLDSHGAAQVWEDAVKAARDAGRGVDVDLSQVTYLDGAGAGLITRLRMLAAEQDADVVLNGLAEEYNDILELFAPDALKETEQPPDQSLQLVTATGRFTVKAWQGAGDLVTFVGEAVYALGSAISHPKHVRWRDVLTTCEKAGVNALPIIALMGFLIGLIMAFQSAIPLQRFGADIYVADFLGIALTRELGPLITAILLTGRSGSAFAAEIGTMKVNEEVDALRTMGLDPVRFLAVPRVLAALLVTPVLTMFFNLFALAGGAVVIQGFGYPVTTFLAHVQSSTQTSDIVGGLFKATVFAALVAGIGCQRGLATAKGAAAVGESTTSSVVSGLVLITVSDGVMAVVFYALGI